MRDYFSYLGEALVSGKTPQDAAAWANEQTANDQDAAQKEKDAIAAESARGAVAETKLLEDGAAVSDVVKRLASATSDDIAAARITNGMPADQIAERILAVLDAKDAAKAAGG